MAKVQKIWQSRWIGFGGSGNFSDYMQSLNNSFNIFQKNIVLKNNIDNGIVYVWKF